MNEQLFIDVYEAQFKRVYNYISYRINNHADTEDLVSRVFSKVIEKYDSYDPSRAVIEAWIIGIAKNVLSDYFRNSQKMPTVELEAVETYLESGQSPEEILIKNERNLALMFALNELGERERHIIALKYGADLANKQIAGIMELSESNIGVILFRSLKKMRKILEAEEAEKEGSVCIKITPKLGKIK